jgi:hypothetical protein
MNLDENTFGDTPAAMYLVRALNELDSLRMLRSAGKRITATRKQIVDLEEAYTVGVLPSKTVANCLRLMRLDITSQENPYTDYGKERLIEQLIRNVQIGYVKKGMRLCSVARKAERKLEVSTLEDGGNKLIHIVKLYDRQSEKYIPVGIINSEGVKTKTTVFSSEVETVTPEVLMARSNRRCARLGKPHMAVRKTRSFAIVSDIMLSFLTHNDSYDTIITGDNGSLEFDGADIIFVNKDGNKKVSVTTNNAIDLWLAQGKIQEV